MALDLNSLVPIYQNAIDDIINQMGKNVTLYFKPTITNVNEEFFDPVRGEYIKKPVYTETSDNPAPDVVQNTVVIKALIQHNPDDFRTLSPDINQPDAVVRLKTYLTYVPDLMRCEYIVVNSDSKDLIDNKYRLIGQPTPIGLKIDRYCISFWKRI